MLKGVLAGLVRLVTGVKVSRLDVNGGEPCIFFANHGSHLDSLVIWAALPAEVRYKVSPVAARDYWTKTRLRRWLATRVFNAVLLDREGRPKDRSHPMSPVLEQLEAGYSVILFPEGTRSLDGRMKRFKAGLHYLHEMHPDRALVPVSLTNLSRILPKGEWLPVPLIGRITVHERMKVLEGEGRKEFLERAFEAVAKALPTEREVDL